MIIPDEIIDKWKALRSESDSEKIAAKTVEVGHPTTSTTVRAVFRTGKANDELFKVMAEYYEEKANMIKEFI